jgi:hypothetical protein
MVTVNFNVKVTLIFKVIYHSKFLVTVTFTCDVPVTVSVTVPVTVSVTVPVTVSVMATVTVSERLRSRSR